MLWVEHLARRRRRQAAVVIGGFLARAGYKAPYAKLFLEAVAVASGQPLDKRRDMIRAAESGVNDFAAGKPVAGFPKMVEVFGEKAAKRVKKGRDRSNPPSEKCFRCVLSFVR